MHFDSDNAPTPVIKLVVYKHSTDDDDVFYCDITSVQEIRYVTTYQMAALHFQAEDLLNSYLMASEAERWYLVSLDIIDGKFIIASIKDVSDDTNEKYKLH